MLQRFCRDDVEYVAYYSEYIYLFEKKEFFMTNQDALNLIKVAGEMTES